MKPHIQQRQRDGKCLRCGFERDTESSSCSQCKLKQAEQARIRRLRNKNLVFETYGGFVCNCCGETMVECLSIDHIDNNGHSHRQELGGGGGSLFYQWLINNDFPTGFQVLCMNCQFGKKHNNGVCPHQVASQALQSASGRQVADALQQVVNTSREQPAGKK